MKNRINFVLGARKILSVNALYGAKMTWVNGRQVATIYKTGEAKQTEAYIKEQIERLNVPVNYPWVNSDTLFKVTIKVVFKSGFLMRDLDNTLKLVQDGIFRGLDINDSHVVSIVADKVLFPDISEEKIYVCLEEVDGSGVRFDILPKVSKIWSTDFNFASLKELPKKGARKGKIYKTADEERADTFVYLVTPGNLHLLTPTRIILRCVEAVLGSKGFVYIGFVGLGDSDAETVKEIDEFKALLMMYSKEYSGIRFRDFEDEPKEAKLLSWISEE